MNHEWRICGAAAAALVALCGCSAQRVAVPEPNPTTTASSSSPTGVGPAQPTAALPTSLPTAGPTATGVRTNPATPSQSSSGGQNPGQSVIEAERAGFVSPSGRIDCAMFPDDGGSGGVRCDFYGEHDWKLPKPADCEFDYGSTVALNDTGKAVPGCVSDSILELAQVRSDNEYVKWHAASGPTVDKFGKTLAVLAYGQTLKVGVYRCSMASVGLTCTNTNTGAHFFISKEKVVLA